MMNYKQRRSQWPRSLDGGRQASVLQLVGVGVGEGGVEDIEKDLQGKIVTRQAPRDRVCDGSSEHTTPDDKRDAPTVLFIGPYNHSSALYAVP